MSALYGSLSGHRGDVTKCGHSYLQGHIRGWTSGVRIEAFHDKDGDVFKIYRTGGSNGSSSDVMIGTICNGLFTPNN